MINYVSLPCEATGRSEFLAFVLVHLESFFLRDITPRHWVIGARRFETA